MTRILLVDDDDQLRSMLRLVLERAGYAVQEARNGNEAISLLDRAPVDLMVTDLIMPDKEGLALILALRRRTNREFKIIAMSGGARLINPEGYLHVAEKFGANRVLKKPFSNQQLLDTVQDTLRQD